MINKSIALVVGTILCSLLVACGGSGGSSDPVAQPKSGTISGVAFDAELKGATVSVSSFDNARSLGETVTDENGHFAVNVLADTDQVICINTRGGSYTDEYTGRVDQEYYGMVKGALRLCVNYAAGSSITVAPTIYSTLAARYADYLVQQGESVSDAVGQANSAISDLISVDITATVPHNVTRQPDSAVSAASLHYGFYSAAISALMASQSHIAPFARSIDFTEYAGADIRDDGKLNESVANNVYVFRGGYRDALAVAMLRMAISDRNATGLSIDQVLELAKRLNDSTSEIFDGVSTVPLETQKPVISNLKLNDRLVSSDVFFGRVRMSFDVGDVFGLQRVYVSIDGWEIDATGVEDHAVDIDTSQLADGEHSVVISATNVAGYTSSEVLTVRTINHGTAITQVSPAEGKAFNDYMPISADIHDPSGVTLVQLFVDKAANPFAVFNEGDIRHFDSRLFTPSFADGNHTLTIKATNGVGVVTDKSVGFTIDNTPPDSVLWVSENSYLEGLESTLVTHEVGSSVQLTLNGIQQNRSSTEIANGVAVSVFTVNTRDVADGTATLAISTADVLGNQALKSVRVYVDNTAPSLRITYPANEGRIAGEFNLRWIAADDNGFGNNQFEILIDGQHYSWVSNWLIQDTINPAIFFQGWHEVTLRVTDASGKSTAGTQLIYFDI